MKIGDIVVLKSDGPMMTVIELTAGNHVKCTWFSEADNEFRSHIFPQAALEEVEFEEDEDNEDENDK